MDTWVKVVLAIVVVWAVVVTVLFGWFLKKLMELIEDIMNNWG